MQELGVWPFHKHGGATVPPAPLLLTPVTSRHAHPQQDADVLGCSVQSGTPIVRAVDTYNIVEFRRNDLDSSGQDQVWECVVEVT